MRISLIVFGTTLVTWLGVWVAVGLYDCDSDCRLSYYILSIAWFVLAAAVVSAAIAGVVVWFDRRGTRRSTR